MGLKSRKKIPSGINGTRIRWVSLVSVERPPFDVGAAECVRLLTAAGLAAKTGPSAYVGHTDVLVPDGTQKKAARVLGRSVSWVRDLVKYGLFDNLAKGGK